jgi:hypothetical protein
MLKTWNKLLSSDEFYKIGFRYFPEWDKVDAEKPYFVKLEIKNGKDKSSHDVAASFDNIITDEFYYRDWTQNGIPIVSEGEIYNSGFWFKRKEDAIKFHEIFGGDINW